MEGALAREHANGCSSSVGLAGIPSFLSLSQRPNEGQERPTKNEGEERMSRERTKGKNRATIGRQNSSKGEYVKVPSMTLRHGSIKNAGPKTGQA